MAYSWGQPISLRGLKGDRGLGFTRTVGKPAQAGELNEVRIDVAAFVLYYFDGSDWQASQSFAGVVGMNGHDTYIGFGDVAPTLSDYSGDSPGLYFVRSTGKIFNYTKAGGWVDSGANTQGPPGEPGSYRYVMDTPPPSDLSTLSRPPRVGDEWVDKGTDGGPYVYWLTPEQT